MNKIIISVAGRVATLASRGVLVCDNDDLKIAFAFDSDWDNVTEPKVARFKWAGGYRDVEIKDGECTVPRITDASVVVVGVYAGELATTTPASIPCKASIRSGVNKAHPEQAKDYRDEAEVYRDEAAESATQARECSEEAAASAIQATAAAKRAKECSDAVGLGADNVKRIDARIDRHEKLLTNLVSGIHSDPFQTDASTAYEKTVPAKACPYAQIDKLGTAGVPVKAGNLVTTEGLDVCGDDTLTFTYENGVLTVEGELTTNGYVDISLIPRLTVGTTLVMNVPDGFTAHVQGFYEAIDSDGGTYEEEAYLYFENGRVTLDDYNAKKGGYFDIMYIELVPLYDMTNPSFPLDLRIQPEKVTALEMQGANLVPFPYLYAVGSTTVVSGVSFTVLEDGGIHIVGTPTEGTSYSLHTYRSMPESPFVAGEIYTISGGQRSIYCNVRTYTDDPKTTTQWILTESTGKANSGKFPSGVKVSQIGIYINPALVGTYIDTVIYLVLNEGSSAYPYGKYCRGTHDLWKIPEDLQSLPDYGKEGAYIDFERRMLVYGENETDISAYLPDDNLFDIDGAKSITAVNKGNNPVASSITYMIKEG